MKIKQQNKWDACKCRIYKFNQHYPDIVDVPEKFKQYTFTEKNNPKFQQLVKIIEENWCNVDALTSEVLMHLAPQIYGICPDCDNTVNNTLYDGIEFMLIIFYGANITELIDFFDPNYEQTEECKEYIKYYKGLKKIIETAKTLFKGN